MKTSVYFINCAIYLTKITQLQTKKREREKKKKKEKVKEVSIRNEKS